MIRQRFEWTDGRIVDIEWETYGPSSFTILSVDGRPRSELAFQDVVHASLRIVSRMAEYGEHKDEPEVPND